MIKKSVHENELISGMIQNLVNPGASEAINELPEAIECLNSVADIFDNLGMIKQSDKIINILLKIAHDNDPATKGLTSEKMVKNLLDHGTEFNMSDDNKVIDLLNLDFDDKSLEVEEKSPIDDEMDFEDEI